MTRYQETNTTELEGRKEQTTRSHFVSELAIPIITISFVFSLLLTTSCAKTETENQESNQVSEKASSQLLAQVNLRKEQIAEPSPDRLELMQHMGMRVDNLGIQRIFIHLEQAPNTLQIEELQAMGIILYLDSWIPPVGVHPYGVLLADMPVDKLEGVAEKDYVVKLDTAERMLEQESGIETQNGIEPLPK